MKASLPFTDSRSPSFAMHNAHHVRLFPLHTNQKLNHKLSNNNVISMKQSNSKLPLCEIIVVVVVRYCRRHHHDYRTYYWHMADECPLCGWRTNATEIYLIRRSINMAVRSITHAEPDLQRNLKSTKTAEKCCDVYCSECLLKNTTQAAVIQTDCAWPQATSSGQH